MTVWNLEPGCERPVPRMNGAPVAKTGIGNLSAAEIANRCESWYGARVEEENNRYKVYPPDPTQRPVFFARKLHNGPEIPNVVNTLRKAGLDVTTEPATEEPAPMKPTPADVAAQIRNGSPIRKSEDQDEQDLLALLAEAERQIDMLKRTTKVQQERIGELDQGVRDATKLASHAANQAIRLADRVARLEQRPTAEPAKSTAQVIREVVLAFLQRRPGERWTPQMIEMNLGEELPERGKTAVASACKGLAAAGLLRGGGQYRKGDPGYRGVYWYEEPADVGDQDITARLAQGE